MTNGDSIAKEAAISAYFRLQDLTSQSATGSQRIEEAIDVSAYRTLVVQTRIPVQAGTSGTLVLEHAAVLDEDAFTTLGSFSINLASDSNDVEAINDPLRFVRWKITAFSGSAASFMIDIVARET